ncbi:hypothetical protein [Bacillus sp. AK031]
MEQYIFALIAFAVLLPVLFFLPGEITKKGKAGIAGGALLISLLGLLAMNQYSLWMVAIILFILVIVSSLMIGNRFSSLVAAEEGLKDANNSTAAENHEDRLEVETENKVLFTSLEEEQEVSQNEAAEPLLADTPIEEPTEIPQESDSAAEELEELPILSDLETEEEEADEVDDDLHKELFANESAFVETLQEEQPSSQQELSEIEALIEKEAEWDQSQLSNEEDLELIEEGTITEEEMPKLESQSSEMDMDEEEQTVELSEIELLISQTDDDSEIPELDLPEIEEDREVLEEEKAEEDGLADMEEVELTEQELDFLKEDEAASQGEQPAPVEADEDLIPLEEENLQDGILTEEIIMEDETIAGEGDSVTKENPNEEAAIIEEQGDIQSSSPLQTRVIHAIAEELAYYRKKLSVEDFEAMVHQYMHPQLHDRDYYVLSKQLIQRYTESKDYKKLKLFIEEIEGRFISYPVLKSELNLYKEMAWKNIIKQMMEQERE